MNTPLALPQLLLIVVTAVLIVWAVAACIRITKIPLSTAALKKNLLLLQSKFRQLATINPETERQEMEKLQNTIKTSCDPLLISNDGELKSLIESNCRSIQSRLHQPDLDNRTGWIKFNALMTDFNGQYFQSAIS